MNRRWRLGALAVALAGCQQTVMLQNAPSDSGAGGDLRGAGGQDGGPDGGPMNNGDVRVDAGSPAPPCTTAMRYLQRQVTYPEVVISFDRSASMALPFGEGTRHTVAQQIVRDSVRAYQGAVRFGYQEFPANTTMCTGALGCCAGRPSSVVLRNFDTIDEKMGECERRQNCLTTMTTPTADALSLVRSAFSMSSGMRERFVLLITDDEPSCSRGGSSMSACEEAVNEAMKLNNDSDVKTIVFAIGEDLARSECLNDLASAGGARRPRPQQGYYAGRDPAQLRTYVTEAVRAIAKHACHIDVLTPPNPSEQVTLYFDHNEVQKDLTNGWNFEGNTTLRIGLYGTACEQLQSGGVREIDVVARCP